MAGRMEVDSEPPPIETPCLKRSSSAPMISLLMDSSVQMPEKQSQDDLSKLMYTSPSLFLSTTNSSFRPFPDNRTRTRHYSTSTLIQPSTPTSSAPVRIPTRIHQLKHEEVVNKNVEREITHEREVQSAMQISQSWDELTLEETMPVEQSKRPRSLSESLHIFTSGFPVASSPSPTRVGKQCFSPSMQVPVIFNGHGFNFTPSPSPSPTRRVHVRRSLSPIVTLKPSALSHKRKIDPDADSGFSQPKRIFSGSLLAATNHSHPPHQQHNLHTHSSLSTGSFDDSASEHSAGTYGSLGPSHCAFSFTPVPDSSSTTTTDSESDMYDTNSSGGR